MSDKYTLRLENFRSIRDATVEIAPLTVVYGPNGSGKSSLIYGLLTLRNFFTNPAQNVPSLFSYPTISLGGLREVVRNHAEDEVVALSLGIGIATMVDSSYAFDWRVWRSSRVQLISSTRTAGRNESRRSFPISWRPARVWHRQYTLVYTRW